MTTRRLGASLAAVLLTGALLGACGSDEKKESTAVTTETYVTVPPAQVTPALAGTQEAMDALAAAPAGADTAAINAINDSWRTYEGNVRAVDGQAYLDGEDALALFSQAAQKADGPGMKAAADKFRMMSQAFTAAHPG